jgi:hypothetical protein
MGYSEIASSRLLELLSEVSSPAAAEAIARMPVGVEHFAVHPASPPGWSHAMEVKFAYASERGSEVSGLSDLVYETAKLKEISIVVFDTDRIGFIVALDVNLTRVIAVLRASHLKREPPSQERPYVWSTAPGRRRRNPA